MDGMRHGHRHGTGFLRAALVHPAAVGSTPFFLEPLRGFINGDDLRMEFLRQRNRIVNVIEVAV